jgi:hypothetical protein
MEPASTADLIIFLDFLQVFTTVSLGRYAISLMTFAIRGGCSVLGGFVNILTANAGNVEVRGGGVQFGLPEDMTCMNQSTGRSAVLGHPGTVCRLTTCWKTYSHLAATPSIQCLTASFRTFICSLVLNFRDLVGLMRPCLTRSCLTVTILPSWTLLLLLCDVLSYLNSSSVLLA